MKRIQKIDSAKNLLKVNETLKTHSEELKKESSYLKLQVQKLQISEKRLHNLLLENEITSRSDYIEYLTSGPNETVNLLIIQMITNENNNQKYINSNSNFELQFSNSL